MRLSQYANGRKESDGDEELCEEGKEALTNRALCIMPFEWRVKLQSVYQLRKYAARISSVK